MPLGSSATSASLCAALFQPNLRLFVTQTGAAGTKVRVQVIVRSLLGALSVIDGGTVSAGSTWQPTPKVLMLASSLTAPVSGSIQFKLTAVGTGGGLRIDDFYVDPFLSK